jgi:hypothetical protein
LRAGPWPGTGAGGRGAGTRSCLPGVEGVAAAADGQFACEHVETLIFLVVDMQRRPGTDGGLKDAQGSTGGVVRRLQARFACHAGVRGNDIASQEVGHGYMIAPRPAWVPGFAPGCEGRRQGHPRGLIIVS